jgi:tetratricopeptide (TPR) repeat protein
MNERGVTLIAVLALVLCAGAAAASEPEFEGDRNAARPIFTRATQEFDARRYEQAAELLQQAFDTWQNPTFMYDIGQCHRLASRYEEALTAYRRYLDISPSPQNITYIQIGECFISLGRREEGNEALRHYLELEENGEFAGQARHSVETGEAPSAQDRRDPEQVREARQVYERAAALYREQQYEQAADLFVSSYERMHGMHEFLYNAGNCYMEAGMWGEAARTFARYVQTPGAEHDAWASLGDCYAQQHQLREAAQAYERYLELEPQGDRADEARRFVSAAAPAEDGAERAAMRATPGDMQRATELVNAGWDHSDAGRYEQALECHRQAYEIVQDRDILFYMGECCAHLGRHAEAVTHFERYLEGGDRGEGAVVHLHAAESLLALGRTSDAARHISAYMTRARAENLLDEEQNTRWARRLQQRAGGGSSD